MNARLTLTVRLDAEVGDRRFICAQQVPHEVIESTDVATFLCDAYGKVATQLYDNLESFKKSIDIKGDDTGPNDVPIKFK